MSPPRAAGADPASISTAVVERDANAIQKDLAMQSGKPEAVVEKMMEGRMRKYLRRRRC